MKTKVLAAIPEIFSLRSNDYSSFVVKGGAEEMMRNNWNGVGRSLNGAIMKVERSTGAFVKVKIGRSTDVQKKQAA